MIINSVFSGNRRSIRIFFSVLSFVFLGVFSPGTTIAQQPYFYKGYDYGSDAVYNPVSVILNGGFDMFQVSHQRDIGKVPFYRSGKNVLKNTFDPIGPVRRYGWWNFVQEQIIPVSLNRDNAQYWSNYTLHLVGGIVLFSFDNVNSFFSETLNLADWSLQPSFSVRDLHLHNVGHFFSIK